MRKIKEYAIHGGDEGAHRLSILSRTLESSTRRFLKTAGLENAMHCLNLGCGIGKVTFMISKIIGSEGRVLGLDIDERNIQIANELANAEHIKNASFKTFDVYELMDEQSYDVVYSRFLFSHLTDPKKVLQKTLQALKPAGKLLIEDTDFSGHFSNPTSPSFDTYVRLYQSLLRKRGANANAGQELAWWLKEVGFTDIKIQISQPVHTEEEGKLMAEITLDGISQALIEGGFITPEEYENIYSELVAFRKRKDTMISLPRIFQVSARRPA